MDDKRVSMYVAGDVIGSSTLSKEDYIALREKMNQIIADACSFDDGSKGVVERGDSISIVHTNTYPILRTVLLMKFGIKSLDLPSASKLMKKHGMKVAASIGELRLSNLDEWIIDGPAAYMAGRALDKMTTKTIKTSLSDVDDVCGYLDMVSVFVDSVVARATRNQSEIMYNLLMGLTQEEVADKLGITQTCVSHQSKAVGWRGIKKVLKKF